MATPEAGFDVIVVGGRVAGSTLAMRLARYRMRVLLLERAPSPFPAPVSCPVIFGSSMALLDELGLREEDYCAGHPKVYQCVLEQPGGFRAECPLPSAHGRNYAYNLDRTLFDNALWAAAARTPGVTARAGFSVTGLLREGDRVVGVRGRQDGGQEDELRAACVVGADGRFSRVAQVAGAAVVESRDQYPSSLLFAYWKGAAPGSEAGPSSHVFANAQGHIVCFMETAGDRLMVSVQGRADLFELRSGEKGEDVYMRLLAPYLREGPRLRNATRVSEVRGMRAIQNLYREPGGPGWALVGDAFHQKDPLDAQGIYDALAGARYLSLAMAAWWQGTATWEAALAWYDAAVRADSYTYFEVTVARVQREFYSGVPLFVWRWISRAQEPIQRFVGLLTRTIDPARWCPPEVVAEALMAGMAEEMFRTVTGRGGAPAPVASPSAPAPTWYDDVALNTARAVLQALEKAREGKHDQAAGGP